MKIVCPSCGAAYQVPEALLAKRHTLKCSACGVKWRLTPLDAPENTLAGAQASHVPPAAAPVVTSSAESEAEADAWVQATMRPTQPAVAPAAPVVAEPPEPLPADPAEPSGVEPAEAAARPQGEATPAPELPEADGPAAEGDAAVTPVVTSEAAHTQQDAPLATPPVPPVSAPEPEPEPEPEPVAPVVDAPVVAELPAEQPAVVEPAPPTQAASPVVVPAEIREEENPAQLPPNVPVRKDGADRMGSAPLAAHIARPAYKLGSGSVLQTVRDVVAGCFQRLAATDTRALLQSERFWRGAWVASVVLALLLVLGAWHWWAALVHAWPAAARLHQPG